MTSVRDQYLYISSKNKHSGNAYDFDVVVNAGMISCKDTEQPRISLVKLSMPLTITQVNNLNNEIVFTNKTTNVVSNISIPVGNYNVYDLALYIKGRLSCYCFINLLKVYQPLHFLFTLNRMRLVLTIMLIYYLDSRHLQRT
jgi:hypothetical protein